MADESARTEQFPVRLTKRIKALLQKLAKEDERSMNDIVILAVSEYAEKREVEVIRRTAKGKWV